MMLDRLSERPMSVWLHLGPNSAGTVCVSFPGKAGQRPITLSNREIYRLHAALGRAIREIAADDGELTTRKSKNLMEQIDV